MIIANRPFHVVGVSYHDSPLDLREKLSFQESTSKVFLKNLREVHGISEAMLISTCNRTELFISCDRDELEEVMKVLCFYKSIDYQIVKNHIKVLSELDAITHLFNVSLGLDAKVLGDIQIINQVKNAYQWSADENMAGPFLHRLMHTIFFANKRVIQETDFRDGSGSVASVTASLIRSQGETVTDPRILLIGLGEIGQNVLENLSEDFTDITIINRTWERAENLAKEGGYRVADFEKITSETNKADVVITAISHDTPLLTSDNVMPSLTQKLLVDLSVPRVIDSSVEKVQGALLYNIDNIEERTSRVLEQREKSLPLVKSIIEENIAEFGNWTEELSVSPTIQLLKERLEQIRKDEVSRHLKNLSEKELVLIETVTKNMIQKVIKLPVLELKAACKRGEAETLVEALNDIFNLEKSAAKKS